MCGIYGIIGNTNTFELVSELEKLEYRGYDSCGIAYFYNKQAELVKTIGNCDNLKNIIQYKNIDIAIGHTRWATHGMITTNNAHPHTTKNNRFFIAHNGVIDNYTDIINKYFFECHTQTDSEVICHLLDMYIKKYDILSSIIKIKEEIKGSYAIVIIDKYDNDKIYFIKNKSPLLIAEDSNKTIIASDQIVFANKMNVTILNDGNYGYITKNSKNIFSNMINEKWNTFYKDCNNEIIKKNKHHMLDEIEYEPSMIKEISGCYIKLNLLDFQKELNSCEEVVFVGSGSSHYAGCILKNIYEKKLNKRCYSVVASELEFFNFLNKKILFIFLSQSGETADLCAGLEYLKKNKCKVISLCNNINSSLGYNSDMIFPLLANREISVASTKAFTAMIFVGCILIDRDYYIDKTKDICYSLLRTLNMFNMINEICSKIANSEKVFYLGKDIDYYIALEASLKLREITYLSSFAFYSGELKHGSIALIDDKTVSIGILTNEEQKSVMKSSLEEIKSRGGKTYLLSNIDKTADIFVEGDILSVIMMIQIIAYKVAIELNRNVDQPRNLAKSVTVI